MVVATKTNEYVDRFEDLSLDNGPCYTASECDAISKSFATITFKPDGTIIDANDNFLLTLGYELHEIQGRHHRMFVESKEAKSREYDEFWSDLRRGTAQTKEFCRVKKCGEKIWIQASYMPVLDEYNRVCRVLKIATDITEHKRKSLRNQALLDALNRTQAVIEFNLDGTIIDANDNFLATLGYKREEVIGKHHRIFMDPKERDSEAYREFWKRLNDGEFFVGEFRRISKSGEPIWIQASYNYIVDTDGRVLGVVKFAIETTQLVKLRLRSLELSETLADSTSQMGSTILEISRNINNNVKLTSTTEESVMATNDKVIELRDRSKTIQNVVKVIQNLASQTHLLALNATIEAARAGEAGRGFAVVATEVKELARQTAAATENIEQSVKGIQASVNQVVSATANITGSIGEVSQNMTAVAAAIEQQSATMASLKQVADDLRATSVRSNA